MTAPPSEPLPIAVLISGAGRTLRNLTERIRDGSLHARIDLVVSSHPEAGGIQIARDAGLPHVAVPREDYDCDESFGAAIFQHVREAQVSLVVLAGFLKFLPVPDDFANRIINIHPALIPSFCGQGFYGHRVHQAAVDYGVKLSGCTVHFVDNQYDHGPIILQTAVPVSHDDTPHALADRVFQQELDALPAAIELFAAGRIHVDGRVVRIDPPQ